MSQDEVEPDKAVDDSTTRWGVFFLQLLGCVVVAFGLNAIALWLAKALF